MFRKIALCIFSFSLIGCSGFLPDSIKYTNNIQSQATKLVIPIYIDYSFNLDEKAQICSSINEWNFALNNQIVLKIVDDQFDMSPVKITEAFSHGGLLILKLENDNSAIPKSILSYGKLYQTAAWADKIGGHEIKIVPSRMKHDRIAAVVLHEIAHILYVEHVTDNKSNVGSLMYPHITDTNYKCIDKETIMQVTNHYNLDRANVNFCQ